MKHTRWWFALALFGFGLFAVGNWTSPKWVAVTLIVYSVPLLTQLLRSRSARSYGLWFGVFLVLQTLITPLVVNSDYVTLAPHLYEQIDVRGDAIPGIGGLQTITTDELGFRTTTDVDYEAKQPGTLRIFAIGGSTTEQILLDDRRTWTHLLQERLSATGNWENVEVINTGVSGTRARQHLATLQRVAQLQPDLVLFLMGINDWNRHIWDELGAAQRVDPGAARNDLQFNQTLLGRAIMALNAAFSEPPPKFVRPEYGEYYSEQNNSLQRNDVKSYRPESVSGDYRDVVDEIASRCVQEAYACMFVSQPNAYSPSVSAEVRRYFWMTPPNTEYTLDLDSLVHIASLYNGFLMDTAMRNGLARCDLAPLLEPTLEVFYDDCHFNVSGAERVAAELASCVTRSLNEGP